MSKNRIFMALIAAVVFVHCQALAAHADIIENFDSYATGNLSNVSSGKWQTWMNSSTDAKVFNDGSTKSMQQDGINIPDVVTYSPNNLLGFNGAAAKLSFKFFVHEPHNEFDMLSEVYVGAGNPGTAGIDYDNLVTKISIDWAGDNPGNVPINLFDPKAAKGGADYDHPLVAWVSAESWHQIDLFMYQTVADMTANDPADADGFFRLYVDGTQVGGNFDFGVDSSFGLNALEFASDSRDASYGYHLYDDISMTAIPTPEPASIMLMAIGIIGFAGMRRRFKKQ